MIKGEDGSSNGGFVTLGRAEFEFLCGKLNTLENSIADLRYDLRRNAHERVSGRQNSVTSGAIDPAMGGGRDSHNHTEVHGLHLKNDGVSLHIRYLCSIC